MIRITSGVVTGSYPQRGVVPTIKLSDGRYIANTDNVLVIRIQQTARFKPSSFHAAADTAETLMGWVRRKYEVRDCRFEDLTCEQQDLVRRWYNLEMLGNGPERRFNIYSQSDPLVCKGLSPVSLVFCGPRDFDRSG